MSEFILPRQRADVKLAIRLKLGDAFLTLSNEVLVKLSLINLTSGQSFTALLDEQEIDDLIVALEYYKMKAGEANEATPKSEGQDGS